MFIIHKIPSGPLFTNAYVIACLATKLATVIDPAPGSTDAITAYLEKNSLICQRIILTHSHWDHIADVSLLNQQLHVPVAIHVLDLPNLQQPGADGLPCLLDFPSVTPDEFLTHNDCLSVGNLSFYVIHTPGHSPGSICLYEPTHKLLISGDTLFQGSMGKINFPTSQPEKMWESLKGLAQLPPQTKVYTGHGPHTTIGQEQNWLAQAKEIFQSY